MRWMTYCLVFLILISGAFAYTFSAECKTDPNVIADCTEVVVEAYPIEISGFIDEKDRVVSQVKFAVLDSFGDEVPGEIEVRHLGGEVENKSMKVIGITYDYELGKNYRLFLEKSTKEDYYMVCCGQYGIEEVGKRDLIINPSEVKFDEINGTSNIFVKIWRWFLDLFR